MGNRNSNGTHLTASQRQIEALAMDKARLLGLVEVLVRRFGGVVGLTPHELASMRRPPTVHMQSRQDGMVILMLDPPTAPADAPPPETQTAVMNPHVDEHKPPRSVTRYTPEG